MIKKYNKYFIKKILIITNKTIFINICLYDKYVFEILGCCSIKYLIYLTYIIFFVN